MTLIRSNSHYKTPVCRFFTQIYLFLFLLCVLFSAGVKAQTATQTKPQPESKLSKKEADELFLSLDEIMRFASQDTKLPIRRGVKRQLSSRDEVAQGLNDRLNDDEDAKRLQSSELVLQKFGFLPRNFDLRTYLVSLMREQVAGYYNIKDKTMYLMDWLPSEQQKPVMAHELTHALQDQNFDLKKWLEGNPEEVIKKSGQTPDKDAVDIESDEEQTARQALVEGQGMAVMIDYILRDSGQTVTTAPAFVEALKQNISESEDSPIYSNAPLYMRESLGFPYRYGLGFVQALLKKGGPELAYAGALKNPPLNSRQIMNPEAYLSGEKLEPLVLPHMAALLGKNYERYDVGSVGQFDVMVLLKQYLNEKLAEKLADEWRGGAYYAALNHEPPNAKDDVKDNSKSDAKPDAKPTDTDKNSDKNKTQKKDTPPTTKSIALFYISRWSTPENAQKFAQAYISTLLQRYRFASQQQPDPEAAAQAGQPGINTHWMTDEGLVSIEQRGNTVLVLESFDAKTQLELSKAVWDEAIQQAKSTGK